MKKNKIYPITLTTINSLIDKVNQVIKNSYPKKYQSSKAIIGIKIVGHKDAKNKYFFVNEIKITLIAVCKVPNIKSIYPSSIENKFAMKHPKIKEMQ